MKSVEIKSKEQKGFCHNCIDKKKGIIAVEKQMLLFSTKCTDQICLNLFSKVPLAVHC